MEVFDAFRTAYNEWKNRPEEVAKKLLKDLGVSPKVQNRGLL